MIPAQFPQTPVAAVRTWTALPEARALLAECRKVPLAVTAHRLESHQRWSRDEDVLVCEGALADRLEAVHAAFCQATLDRYDDGEISVDEFCASYRAQPSVAEVIEARQRMMERVL